jgi:Na+/phosphate symporter
MAPAVKRVFERVKLSPDHIHQALRSYSASVSSFSLTKDEAVEKYKDKWIAIYNGSVEAVADTLEQLSKEIADKHIPASETLFRHIDPMEKVFIL